MDTNGNKFGGYTTSSWRQPSSGSSYARDTDAFIFNLSKKLKYVQPDKFGKNSIYRDDSYGPVFGSNNLSLVSDPKKNPTFSYFVNFSNLISE